MLGDLGRLVVAAQQDVGEALVVAQQHVVARPQLLDQVGFEQQRLGFRPRGDELHVRRLGDHARDGIGVGHAARIGRDPVLQVLGLADIEHLAGGIEHPVDAGLVGQMLGEAGDDLDAVLQRPRRGLAEIKRRRRQGLLGLGFGGGPGVRQVLFGRGLGRFAIHASHVGCARRFVMSAVALAH